MNHGALRAAVLVLARSWCPEIAYVVPEDWKPILRAKDGRIDHPVGSWITYLSGDLRGQATTAWEGAREEVEGGLLLSATTDIFRADDPKHAEAAMGMHEALRPVRERLIVEDLTPRWR